MADQTSLERMLRLMKLLTGNVNYTVDELARRLGISYRSVYRYIDTFKEAGFSVEKVESGIYKMGVINRKLPDFSKLVYFSEEEAYIVNSLIDSLTDDVSVKLDLQRKLSSLYDSTAIAEYVGKKFNGTNVAELMDAVRNEKQVILHLYESSHSNDIRDRRVEPFGFTPNNVQVWAYDLEDGQNKLFKVSRIDWVEVLDGWTCRRYHRKGYLDPFRIASYSPVHVKFEMNLRARNLLIEEFPMAEKYVQKEGDSWVFDGNVAKMEGVGRFVIGLAADIRIIDSPALQKYVDGYVSTNLLKQV